MSSLNTKYNIETNDWHVEYWDHEPNNHVIRMGMTDGSPVGTNIYFYGLSFGYDIIDVSSGTTVVERTYPMEGHTLVCSDQEYLEEDGIVLKRNTQYRARFWACHREDTYETALEFITPNGVVNYQNFNYNAETNVYEPPTNPPDDGNVYIWNDTTGQWEAFVDDPNEPEVGLNNYTEQGGEAAYQHNEEDKYERVDDPNAERTIQGGRTPNWQTVHSTPEGYAERTEQGY